MGLYFKKIWLLAFVVAGIYLHFSTAYLIVTWWFRGDSKSTFSAGNDAAASHLLFISTSLDFEYHFNHFIMWIVVIMILETQELKLIRCPVPSNIFDTKYILERDTERQLWWRSLVCVVNWKYKEDERIIRERTCLYNWANRRPKCHLRSLFRQATIDFLLNYHKAIYKT